MEGLSASIHMPAKHSAGPSEAFADACADSSSVGLGGYVKFPSGLTRFFQASIPKSALAPLCPFFTREGNPQHFIAAWELLAQCALVWAAHGMLPLAHPNVHMVLRCDNAASEAAAWKGLSLAKALCTVLRQFSDLQRRTCISARIEHVPGFLNVLADCLSRSQDALALGLSEADRVYPPWREFFYPVRPQVSPWRLMSLNTFLLFCEFVLWVGPAGSF